MNCVSAYLNKPTACWNATCLLGSSGPSLSLLTEYCLLEWPPRGRETAEGLRLEEELMKYRAEDGQGSRPERRQ